MNHVIDGDDDRVVGLAEGLLGEEGVVGGMEDVKGLSNIEPAEVVGPDALRDAGGPEASIFLEGEVGVSGIVALLSAVDGVYGGLSVLGEPIDDVGEVAADASSGLVGVDLAVI